MSFKKKILIHSVFPAPYRVGVFKELQKEFDLFVVFERNNDSNRSEEWFVKDFGFEGVILDNESGKAKYKNELKEIQKYDAILAYDYSSVSCMKLMVKAIRTKIPYFVNCDGAFINSNKLIKDAIKNFFIKNAAGCFASGEYAKKYFLKHGAKNENIFIHNFSSLSNEDIELMKKDYNKKEVKTKLKLPLDKKVVISVGQFTHRKGFDILLNSWKHLDMKDGYLLIIGGGEDKHKYYEQIKKERIKNVKILDFQSKEILNDYYRASDLFTMTTREDIWGLVINEAMACGLPVITTNKCIAGLELIEDGNEGFIVDLNDVKKIVNKMSLILNDDNLRQEMNKRVKEKISMYTYENISKSHIDSINLILKK